MKSPQEPHDTAGQAGDTEGAALAGVSGECATERTPAQLVGLPSRAVLDYVRLCVNRRNTVGSSDAELETLALMWLDGLEDPHG